MKIIKNTTNLDKKKLQSLFSFIHKLIANKEGRLKHWWTLKVQVENKSYGYSGRAYIGRVYGHGWDLRLRVSESTKENLSEFSQLFAHELMHSYGYNHKGFQRNPLNEVQITQIKLKFGSQSFLRIEKPKVKTDYVALRKERAEVNLSVWESKFNFAKNKVKKYKKQVAYYQKQRNSRLC